MSTTTRAKFRCTGVKFQGDHNDPNTARTYEFSAVYDTSTPENARFTKATPWAELKMTVTNPAVQIAYGEEFYVDFTLCDEAIALASMDIPGTAGPGGWPAKVPVTEETVEDHSRDVAS